MGCDDFIIIMFLLCEYTLIIGIYIGGGGRRINVLAIKEPAICSVIWHGLSGETQMLKIQKEIRNIFTSKRGKTKKDIW